MSRWSQFRPGVLATGHAEAEGLAPPALQVHEALKPDPLGLLFCFGGILKVIWHGG
ncbi:MULTISPECIES: hypothetical protein [unclassified Mesorhizobium]|uniref:hypothetical protein n=1 Tax=unclassified Mesorhizobium TaxID=325217 RepID=UPI0013DFBB5D|nr:MULTISPECIES: hypothetical protein [unclassified Mesorhizobium]